MIYVILIMNAVQDVVHRINVSNLWTVSNHAPLINIAQRVMEFTWMILA